MSFSGALGFSLSAALHPHPPEPYDYLYPDGMGLLLLQSVAIQTVGLLLGNKSGYIDAGKAAGTYVPPMAYVQADPLVAAIWSGHTDAANLFAVAMVNTMVAEERAKAPAARMQLTSFIPALVVRLMQAMHNSGDPASCMLHFESAMGAWKNLYPAIQNTATSTGWCQRELRLVGECMVTATCAMTMDANGKSQPIGVPAPPRGAITAPPPASAYAPVAPPTHAQIQQQMTAGGESLETLEKAKELSELGVYMASVAQARIWMRLALGLPATSSDQEILGAIAARGIEPGEALDWFTACDAELECFRERMNAALGESDITARDAKMKTFVVAGVALATAFALFTWKRKR